METPGRSRAATDRESKKAGALSPLRDARRLGTESPMGQHSNRIKSPETRPIRGYPAVRLQTLLRAERLVWNGAAWSVDEAMRRGLELLEREHAQAKGGNA